MQGSPESETARNKNETQHRVILTRAFEMMKTEVTRQQFEQVMDYNPADYSDEERFYPVDRVGWYDAIAFANALSKLKSKTTCFILTEIHCRDGSDGDDIDYCKDGGGINKAEVELNQVGSVYDCTGYRLPTEAEWEYAARAGTTTEFYAGNITHIDCSPPDPVLSEIAWYCGNSDIAGDGNYGSQRVCSKAPNNWGLFDMSGNLWEWVWDWQGEYPHRQVTDPQGPKTGTHKIQRGGSWRYDAHRARSAYRIRNFPKAVQRVTGFRLVRTINDGKLNIPNFSRPAEKYLDKTEEIAFGLADSIMIKNGEAFVPAGIFTMACERNDIDCYGDEIPLHDVYVSDFHIDVFEATNEQYADYLNNINTTNECLGDVCAYSTHPDAKGMYTNGDQWLIDASYEQRPVINVTWYGAMAYCEHFGKRLPTAAEWEKAAKGENEHYIFPWGDQWIENASNQESNNDPFESGPRPRTTPVGYFDGTDHGGEYATTDGRSPYGVHDMVGNVWNWVFDYYDPYYYLENPEGGWIDPTGPEQGTRRGLRGGSFQDLEKNQRASELHMNTPESYSIYFGFRCVREP